MHRLDVLESENKKLRRQGMMLVLLIAILLGLATALVFTAARHGMPGFVPSVVEAKEFMLRDAQGKVRGLWGPDEQGAMRLVLQDDVNQTSVKFSLLEDGATGLTFTDSTGMARLVLAVLPDQTVNLVMADGRGTARTVLGLNPNGGSTLVFADQGGTSRAGIGVDHRGRSMLSVGQETAPPPAEEPVDSAPPKPDPRRRR